MKHQREERSSYPAYLWSNSLTNQTLYLATVIKGQCHDSDFQKLFCHHLLLFRWCSLNSSMSTFLAKSLHRFPVEFSTNLQSSISKLEFRFPYNLWICHSQNIHFHEMLPWRLCVSQGITGQEICERSFKSKYKMTGTLMKLIFWGVDNFLHYLPECQVWQPVQIILAQKYCK